MENQTSERSTATGSLAQADHDALIELRTKFTSFFERYTVDMRELKDGIKARVDDHELRIKKIENEGTAIGGVPEAYKRFLVVEKWVEDYQIKWRTLVAAGVGIGSLVTFILSLIAQAAGLFK